MAFLSVDVFVHSCFLFATGAKRRPYTSRYNILRFITLDRGPPLTFTDHYYVFSADFSQHFVFMQFVVRCYLGISCGYI